MRVGVWQGGGHSAAVDLAGNVFLWGRGRDGQLGCSPRGACVYMCLCAWDARVCACARARADGQDVRICSDDERAPAACAGQRPLALRGGQAPRPTLSWGLEERRKHERNAGGTLTRCACGVSADGMVVVVATAEQRVQVLVKFHHCASEKNVHSSRHMRALFWNTLETRFGPWVSVRVQVLDIQCVRLPGCISHHVHLARRAYADCVPPEAFLTCFSPR